VTKTESVWFSPWMSMKPKLWFLKSCMLTKSFICNNSMCHGNHPPIPFSHSWNRVMRLVMISYRAMPMLVWWIRILQLWILRTKPWANPTLCYLLSLKIIMRTISLLPLALTTPIGRNSKRLRTFSCYLSKRLLSLLMISQLRELPKLTKKKLSKSKLTQSERVLVLTACKM